MKFVQPAHGMPTIGLIGCRVMNITQNHPKSARRAVACLAATLAIGGAAVASANTVHSSARAPLSLTALKVTPTSATVGQSVAVTFRLNRAGRVSVLIRSARTGKAAGAYPVTGIKGRNRVALIGSGALRTKLKAGRYLVSANGGRQAQYGDVPTVNLTIRK
jgi:hypothetical protein